MIIKKGDRIKTEFGEIRRVHGIYDTNSHRMVDSNEGLTKCIIFIDADNADSKDFPYGYIQPENIQEVLR